MFGKKAYFTDSLKARKSMRGFYSQWDATSGTDTSGNISLAWNNVQSVSTRHFMDDFMVRLEFEFNFTISTTAQTGKIIYLNKDISTAFNTQVSLSGGLSRENSGLLSYLFKAYSEKFKSVPNYDVQDMYIYEAGTNTTLNTSGPGIVLGSGLTATSFKIITCVPIYHEYLINGVGGITGLTIRMNFANNLYNLIATDADLTKISGWSATCRKASLTYTNYETPSDTFNIIAPHFDMFYVNTNVASSVGTAVAQTRNAESTPNAVFQFITQNPFTFTGIDAHNLQKPLKIDKVVCTVNGNSNAFNTSEAYDNFSRCKSYRTGRYLGELEDWMTQKTRNGFGCVLKVDMGYLDVNQMTSETFRFASQTEFNTSYDGTIGHDYSNLYMYTVYCYEQLITISPTEAQAKFTAELIGEPEEYDDLYDELYIAGGFWDKIKSFGKKVIKSAPGLISKAQQISDIVAPGNKATTALAKANDISQILASSTSIF